MYWKISAVVTQRKISKSENLDDFFICSDQFSNNWIICWLDYLLVVASFLVWNYIHTKRNLDKKEYEHQYLLLLCSFTKKIAKFYPITCFSCQAIKKYISYFLLRSYMWLQGHQHVFRLARPRVIESHIKEKVFASIANKSIGKTYCLLTYGCTFYLMQPWHSFILYCYYFTTIILWVVCTYLQ